jgi:hypothetical protein
MQSGALAAEAKLACPFIPKVVGLIAIARRMPTISAGKSGLIEIRQLDLVLFDIRVLANGKFN